MAAWLTAVWAAADFCMTLPSAGSNILAMSLMAEHPAQSRPRETCDLHHSLKRLDIGFELGW